MNNEKEFKDFLNSHCAPSEELNTKVIAITKKQFLVESYLNILKVLFIHIGAGIITLSICPQFGFNPLGADPHFAHKFMSYGSIVCGAFCGSIFMGSGTLLSILFLGSSTLRSYNNFLFSKTLFICAFFILLMMLFGNIDSSAYYMDIGYLAGWLIVGFLISALPLKASYGLKKLKSL